jgi:DNA-binding MarR family transcriptional regulator
MIHHSEVHGGGQAAGEPVDFGILLALAYTAFVDELRAALADAGFADLHRSFGYVARALAERPLTLRELADRLEITSQGMLKIVDEIEARGYVRRLADPADGRTRRVDLTPRGRSALAEARAFHRRFEKRLGKARAAAIRSSLSEIVEQRTQAGAPPALRPI